MILVTSLIGVFGMIALPIGLGFWLTRAFRLPWRLFWLGALAFLASQVVHIPVLYGLTAAFQGGVLPSPPLVWQAAFDTVVLGLLAGLFEETARWGLFRFFLRDRRTWNEGVLVGAGHGGIEAFLLGVIGLVTVGTMVVLRTADLTMLGVPAEQVDAMRLQVMTFWEAPAYMGLLGLVERVFAITLHIALSVMVLYGIVSGRPIWFWLAVLWHAVVDGMAVYLLPRIGALAVEGVVGGMALISLGILFGLRQAFVRQDPDRGGQEPLSVEEDRPFEREV